MFLRVDLQGLGGAQRRHWVASPQFQIRFPEERIDKRPNMAHRVGAPGRPVDQFACPIDFAQLPHGHGEER
jgi:hypothetical protein